MPVWPDLQRVVHPARVDDRARGADGRAQRLGQLLDQVEVLGPLEAAAAGDDDLRLGERHLALRRARDRDHDLRARGGVDGCAFTTSALRDGVRLARAAKTFGRSVAICGSPAHSTVA